MADTVEAVRRRFSLILEGLPDDVPTAVRLRRALKALLRSYGLRCVEAEELEGNTRGTSRS